MTKGPSLNLKAVVLKKMNPIANVIASFASVVERREFLSEILKSFKGNPSSAIALWMNWQRLEQSHSIGVSIISVRLTIFYLFYTNAQFYYRTPLDKNSQLILNRMGTQHNISITTAY